jgi:hypothetical protein
MTSRSVWGPTLFLSILAAGLAACDEGDEATPNAAPTAGSAGSTAAGSGGAPSAAGSGGTAGANPAGAAGASVGEAGATGVAGSAGASGSGGEAGAPPDPRYVTRVTSFSPGPGAGFGQARLPDVVFGPPLGGGMAQGSLDVVSLGQGGEIVVEFATNAAVDGPGVDFIVFENVFAAAGGGTTFRELGEVSVSEDGSSWATFPCDPTLPDEGSCAGRGIVYANPASGVSALDPATAGGDQFDLALVGLARARFVRVRDLSKSANGSPSAGFDLDAVAIVNAETP